MGTALSAPCLARYSAQPATAQLLVSVLVSFTPARSRSPASTTGIMAGHVLPRTAMNEGQHCWKACWGQPLASSNLASSATLICGNAGRNGRRAGAAERRLSHFLAQFRASSGGVRGFAAAVVPGHSRSGLA